MSQDVVVFSFESKNVRTLTIDGETFFRASDVSAALSMRSPDLVRNIDEEEDVRKVHTLTEGGQQEVSYFSEAGLYTVLLRSNKAEAKPFRRWVTREVLPAIRKQGFYMSEQLKEELVRKEQVILALQADRKKRKSPRLRVPNFNVFEGHEPKWELQSITNLTDPMKTLGLLRKTISQIEGLRKLAESYRQTLGISES
jgi:prophage antirepressor-like protein